MRGVPGLGEAGLRLEGLLEQLPAPPAPADKKAGLVSHLTRGEPIITRPLALPAAPREFHPIEFLRRNATLIGGLAAALLIALGAWALFPRNGPKSEMASIPDDPFLKKMVQRTWRSRRPTRLPSVSRCSAAWPMISRRRPATSPASPARMRLRDLARWYDKVVKDAIVKQVEKMPVHAMPPAERQAQFKALAERLGETAAETDQLLGAVPPDAKPALQKIVDAARDGQKRLQRTTELTELVGKEKD